MTTSGKYTKPNPGPDDADLMTLAEFRENVRCDMLTDYDGHGHPSNGSHMDESVLIQPSSWRFQTPKDATHIVWYNK